MPASSANKPFAPAPLPALLAAVILLSGTAARGETGDEFSDDARIKANFETRLGDLFEAGGIPTGSATLKQLHRESSGPIVLPATPDPAVTTAKPAAAIYDHTRRATLILGHLYLCGKCDKYHANLAGGVLISSDGLALTNYHVLDTREGIVFGAMTVDGRVFAIDEVLAASKKDDIALIRLRNAADLPHVAIRETIATGDEVFVISHPDGFFHTFTKGYLSRKYLKPQGKVPRLQITADFAKGSSGAGIFNVTGELVGLATATNSIYYSKEDDSPRNLQMVIKSGVPISSIRSWFAEPAKD
jgi:S1-C subfamily serine protease